MPKFVFEGDYRDYDIFSYIKFCAIYMHSTQMHDHIIKGQAQDVASLHGVRTDPWLASSVSRSGARSLCDFR